VRNLKKKAIEGHIFGGWVTLEREGGNHFGDEKVVKGR
jgi:hypothetical protein